ncbi:MULTISPECIES: hypothetical protein [Pseudomonas]|uniref:Uncharacterized protein n=1 Tax=Pseudomonas flexibilis TaxID=706570 RepID=A0A0B3BWS9_9PSED|nr:MULTISPECIES: hypothetical protein [Pseudomonas]KHL67776.1 hypothetical protein SF06_34440 [Pseudomonas flexibilis]KHO63857.1 hypothetical protein PT85_15325 [Pseudomonas flexibilis]SCY24505.1 hypothetical protein SAMN02927929_01998 [Pseudomonas flexibilis]SIR44983.1 hypothetical protein SAMN05421672_12520 [Pseudomonas flexibilis]
MHASEDDELYAGQALIEAIEAQLEGGEPPATRAVYNKLSLVGYEREEILQMMALVLADEVRVMLNDNRPFDGERYERLLRALPELPDEAAEH